MKIQELLEALSQTDVDNLNNAGYHIVSEHSVGAYTLYLLKMPTIISNAAKAQYQLGLNKNDTSFTDYAQHTKKFIDFGENVPLSQIANFLGVIGQWVKKHDKLILSSANPQKTQRYERILNKYLPNIDIRPINIGGQASLVLSNK